MRINCCSLGESRPISSSRAGNKFRCMCILTFERFPTLLPLFSGFYDGRIVAPFSVLLNIIQSLNRPLLGILKKAHMMEPLAKPPGFARQLSVNGYWLLV